MAAYILALINNHEDGKRFFETYNIPYQIITRGENKGKLRVKATRSSDGQAVLEARKELEYAGYGSLADHSNVFRDENDGCGKKPPRISLLSGYQPSCRYIHMVWSTGSRLL